MRQTSRRGNKQKGTSDKSKKTSPSRHTRFEYDSIVTEGTKLNRTLGEIALTDVGCKFTPAITDGEGHPVHVGASASNDPVIAGMLFNMILDNDMKVVKEMGEKGGLGVLFCHILMDLYNMNVKIAAAMDGIRYYEKEMMDFRDEEPTGNALKASELEEQFRSSRMWSPCGRY